MNAAQWDEFVCDACGATVESRGQGPPGRCRSCDGWVRPRDVFDGARSGPGRDGGTGDPDQSRLDPLEFGAGRTPLVDCPSLADELGVERVSVKDEGQTPTGSIAVRGASLALDALAGRVEGVRHASTGSTAVAIAAAAARAGIESTAFVPARAPFAHKAMVNVHGGDMRVIDGTVADAAAACRDAEGAGRPVGAFDTPLRVGGPAAMVAEVVAAGDVDAIVCPVGAGSVFVGCSLAAESLAAGGDDPPTLHAVQAAGSDPLVAALERDAESIAPVDAPDTVVSDLAVPEPDDAVLRAARRGDGAAVSVPDDETLAAGARIAAGTGVGPGLAGAVAAAGADRLAAFGAFEPDDHVVVLNPSAPTAEADVLRSHLMRAG